MLPKKCIGSGVTFFGSVAEFRKCRIDLLYTKKLAYSENISKTRTCSIIDVT